LNSKHFHRGWTRKPHEHKPNSEIGRVSFDSDMGFGIPRYPYTFSVDGDTSLHLANQRY
jgi:hypothetical protein